MTPDASHALVRTSRLQSLVLSVKELPNLAETQAMTILSGNAYPTYRTRDLRPCGEMRHRPEKPLLAQPQHFRAKLTKSQSMLSRPTALARQISIIPQESAKKNGTRAMRTGRNLAAHLHEILQ